MPQVQTNREDQSVDASPSYRVLRALADAKGVAPTELETPLYRYVDPEALDDLFRPKPDGSPRGEGRVVFTVEDATVVVSATDGTCSVTLSDDQNS